MKNNIRWGIIGLGKIAHKFAADLMLVESAILQGVASRSEEKAKAFSSQYGAINHYASYEALLNDPEIDIVYIATPHVLHFENTMSCLEHNKAVLCEKPMGMNARQVAQMIQKAQEKELFLMEGIWTRFVPATKKLLELLDQNAIGAPLHLRADFGFKAAYEPEKRLFKKALGGGALLDIGLYPLFISLLVLGRPTSIKALARFTETGVDSYVSMLAGFEGSAKALLEASLESKTPTVAEIYGTHGKIKMHSRFHQSEAISLYDVDEKETRFDLPLSGNGYVHEIEEVHACLSQDQKESEKLPLATSLAMAKLLDQVRQEIGLNYDA